MVSKLVVTVAALISLRPPARPYPYEPIGRPLVRFGGPGAVRAKAVARSATCATAGIEALRSAIRATVQAEAILASIVIALSAPFAWTALLVRLVVITCGRVTVTACPDTPSLASGGVACVTGFVFRREFGPLGRVFVIIHAPTDALRNTVEPEHVVTFPGRQPNSGVVSLSLHQ